MHMFTPTVVDFWDLLVYDIFGTSVRFPPSILRTANRHFREWRHPTSRIFSSGVGVPTETDEKNLFEAFDSLWWLWPGTEMVPEWGAARDPRL